MLLLSSHKLTKVESLNPTQGYGLNLKSHKERVGESFFGWLMKNTWGSTPATLEPAPPKKWSSWGTYNSYKEN
jgi:hypothetical protein